MSDEFHRPTLTFPTGAYNATQVRLYGLAPKSSDTGVLIPQVAKLRGGVGELEVSISVTTGLADEDERQFNALNPIVQKLREDCKTDGQIFSELVKDAAPIQGLDGQEPKLAYVSKISIQMKQLGSVWISSTITRKQAVESNRIISCGIIVGYAYEGHTYDLPKPKIMIIPTLPEPKIPKDDSGFDEKEDYSVWLVDKLDECVEFELNQGFVEQLILDANLPGKRAPNMYAGRMMMGHRSGRLTE